MALSDMATISVAYYYFENKTYTLSFSTGTYLVDNLVLFAMYSGHVIYSLRHDNWLERDLAF